MITYNFDMSTNLLDAAGYLQGKNTPPNSTTCQTVIYLSLESIEISLKALLEKAGYPVSDLKKLGHDVGRLFDLLCFCHAPDENGRWRPPLRIRGEVIKYKYPEAEASNTVGELMERLGTEASKYPNDLRYANEFTHFPAEIVIAMAQKVHDHCENHMAAIRLGFPLDAINKKVFQDWACDKK